MREGGREGGREKKEGRKEGERKERGMEGVGRCGIGWK